MEKYKKMLVSERCGDWEELYVVHENISGGCLAVVKGAEKMYEDTGEIHGVGFFRSCKPIPEKKKRWMTREEILCFALDNPRMLVKNTIGGNDFDGAFSYFYKENVGKYDYVIVPEGYKGDFSDLELKKFEVEAEDDQNWNSI